VKVQENGVRMFFFDSHMESRSQLVSFMGELPDRQGRRSMKLEKGRKGQQANRVKHPPMCGPDERSLRAWPLQTSHPMTQCYLWYTI